MGYQRKLTNGSRFPANGPFTIEAWLADVLSGSIRPVRIHVRGGRIHRIEPTNGRPTIWVLPPFVDGHVHVESGMVAPPGFARLAVAHGTVASVSDPHEIANVLGVLGVEYMIAEGGKVPFKFCWG